MFGTTTTVSLAVNTAHTPNTGTDAVMGAVTVNPLFAGGDVAGAANGGIQDGAGTGHRPSRESLTLLGFGAGTDGLTMEI